MAHAGSRSAHYTKGGTLKFEDVVRERLRGPAFGQEFTTWLDEIKLWFETAQIPASSRTRSVEDLVAFLETPIREMSVAQTKCPYREGGTPGLNLKLISNRSSRTLRAYQIARASFIYYAGGARGRKGAGPVRVVGWFSRCAAVLLCMLNAQERETKRKFRAKFSLKRRCENGERCRGRSLRPRSDAVLDFSGDGAHITRRRVRGGGARCRGGC